MVAVIGLFGGVMRSHAVDFDPEHLDILSRLQAMSQGTYSESEWNAITGELDAILEKSRKDGNWSRYVETQIIRSKAMMMRSDDDKALALMKSTLAEFGDSDLPAMKKVYVEIASIEAARGNQQGVDDIMRAFSKSRHYDPETYAVSGGSGPGDPILLGRPKASDGESISITSMKVYQAQASHGVGQPFPSFTARGVDGESVSLNQFRGQVLLVDFWTEGWSAWKHDLAYRKSVYDRHHDRGFEIIGMCINPDVQSSVTFAKAEKVKWPLAVPPQELLRALGLYGECANYLLDRNGTIIGRDLYGADLDAAVAAALLR